MSLVKEAVKKFLLKLRGRVSDPSHGSYGKKIKELVRSFTPEGDDVLKGLRSSKAKTKKALESSEKLYPKINKTRLKAQETLKAFKKTKPSNLREESVPWYDPVKAQASKTTVRVPTEEYIKELNKLKADLLVKGKKRTSLYHRLVDLGTKRTDLRQAIPKRIRELDLKSKQAFDKEVGALTKEISRARKITTGTILVGTAGTAGIVAAIRRKKQDAENPYSKYL